MTREKIDAMYVVLLGFVHFAYNDGAKEKDTRIHNIIKELYKKASKMKKVKGDKQATEQWFETFKKIEQNEGVDEGRSVDVAIIYLLQYLVAEHRYSELIAKFSNVELMRIINELEIHHKQVCMNECRAIAKYLDTEKQI